MNKQSAAQEEQGIGRGFRQRIADNVFIVAGSLVIAGFTAGWTAHQEVLKAGGWILITQADERERNSLKAENAKMAKDLSALEKDLALYKTIRGTIDAPREGDFAYWQTSVKGRLFGTLKQNQHLWLVVHPESSTGWYPQNSQIAPTADGFWEQPVTIGERDSQQDLAKKHELVLVLAEQTANRAFDDYLKRGQETGVWPASPLPDDVTFLSKVTVIRK